MRQARAAFFFFSILSGLTFKDVSAQTPLLPSSVGVDLGMGPRFPKAVDPGDCNGLPAGAVGVRLGWTAHRFIQFQATASTFGDRWGGGCSSGDVLPCPPDQPCPRAEGIGKDLKPVGVRLLIEPTGGEAQVNPRFIAGAGRLIGDGESYVLIGAGFRSGDRSGPSLTLDFEHFFFHAPVEVFESRTNEFLSDSRDAVTMSLLRIGLEWGF